MNVRSQFDQVHVSWWIALSCFGFVLGVLSALWVQVPLQATGVAVATLLCVSVAAYVRRRKLVVIVAMVCFSSVLGMLRGSIAQERLTLYDQLYHKPVTLNGVVAEDPRFSEGNTTLIVQSLDINGTIVPGTVWLRTAGELDIRRSDMVRATGQLDEGFGTIPAALYRAEILRVQRRDYADVGRDVRDQFAHGLRSVIDEPEASLAAGFIVGQKSNLPESLDDSLRVLGLTHIVVASGFNLSVLVRAARKIFAQVSRFTALAGAGVLVVGFTQITGASPSMARASLVTGISLVAWFYGRTVHPAVLLAVVAAATVAGNPSYAWGDLGWLLSFTSFVGVMILAPLLQAYFWGDQHLGFVRQVLVETVSAQILTLPLIAYVFGEYTGLSLLANVLVVPFIAPVMLFGFIGGVVGMVWSSAGAVLALPASGLLWYMTWVVERLALWPQAQSVFAVSLTGAGALYAAIVVLVGALRVRTGYVFKSYNIVE